MLTCMQQPPWAPHWSGGSLGIGGGAGGGAWAELHRMAKQKAPALPTRKEVKSGAARHAVAAFYRPQGTTLRVGVIPEDADKSDRLSKEANKMERTEKLRSQQEKDELASPHGGGNDHGRLDEGGL